ncbi:uncharacterized protein ANIA_07543 [Aspergillus nidulans FGSC A4]|uniref:Acetamidase n=1 Tax=Emericella nidulans (strain FGSC A4 / ATCC 38163 / CBS 112.46 / NRRL 194 / M139) TaxID=227321 RepID=C8VBM9_EMENI|nr:hypothetical protein [Aspergillus nidulans FGSC A4]CBF79601.1 TPA: conserved hypothetical protein [Aspergillus nidulans FGSC A4]
MDRSEILVHISAPSSAVDDARYRAQVEAILNFQSHSRETITLTSPIPEEADPRTINDPSLLDQAAQLNGSQGDRTSLETPVSVIPDSQPELQQSGTQCESLTLLPVAENTSLSSCIPSKRPRVDSPPPVENSPHENVQGLRDIPAGGRNINVEHASPTSTTNTLATPEEGHEKQVDENGIQPPSAEQVAGLEPGPEPDPETEAEASSPPNGRRKGYSPILPSLPLEIRPPPPPISSSPFTTHITPTLEMLSNRLKSPRTYNPVLQTRDLDILERGYWYLRLTIVPRAESEFENQNQTAARTSSKVLCWDKPLFTRFWTFLSDFIGKEGRAGWGVWCILEERERDWDRDASGEDTTSAEPIVAQSVSLKVYAWGEIATHIYLLLFLASERRVRKLGAQWRDGRDEVVIQMPESGMGM